MHIGFVYRHTSKLGNSTLLVKFVPLLYDSVIQVSILFKTISNSLETLYGKAEANSLARIVFKEKLGISRADMAMNPNRLISKIDEENILRICKKLSEGYPIQQVMGYADFYGLRFKVNKYTLIPRPETEELVQWIIEENRNKKGLKILDIGTGSGCIAILLGKELNIPEIRAIDISSKALKMAIKNAEENSVHADFSRLDILKKDNWDKLDQFDIIVSNPPYVTEKEKTAMHINVLEHDPHSALFVPDKDPLLFYEAISEMARTHLTPNGKLYFEINEAYGEDIKIMLESKGYSDVIVRKDLNGKDRMAGGLCKTYV